MTPSAISITVALDMSKAFDTINIHTLIRKLLQTKIPGTIIKLITNYIKGCKAYTTYRNHTSSQRLFKTGVPQDGVPSPTVQPMGSGPYLRPKTHIQHTHSQHLKTSTQSTTNDKSTHSNWMG